MTTMQMKLELKRWTVPFSRKCVAPIIVLAIFAVLLVA